jgi:hypothetical protein
MWLRSDPLNAAQQAVVAWGATYVTYSRRIGVSRPWPNHLLRERVSQTTLGALVELATGAGFVIRLNIRAAA